MKPTAVLMHEHRMIERVLDCLEKLGATVRLQSAIPMDKLAEPFILRRATRHLERNRNLSKGSNV